MCIDRARRGAAPGSLSPFPILSLSLSPLRRTPRWTSIYVHDVSAARHFFLSGLPRFSPSPPLPSPLPFNSLRANHPSLMSTSRSIGRCFCRSTNTDSELQTPRRADTDLLDTLQPPPPLLFFFSFSSLSSLSPSLPLFLFHP